MNCVQELDDDEATAESTPARAPQTATADPQALILDLRNALEDALRDAEGYRHLASDAAKPLIAARCTGYRATLDRAYGRGAAL